MKITVSIYNATGLVAQKTLNGEKQARKFEKDNIPAMTMQQKVKDGWRVFRS